MSKHLEDLAKTLNDTVLKSRGYRIKRYYQNREYPGGQFQWVFGLFKDGYSVPDAWWPSLHMMLVDDPDTDSLFWVLHDAKIKATLYKSHWGAHIIRMPEIRDLAGTFSDNFLHMCITCTSPTELCIKLALGGNQ